MKNKNTINNILIATLILLSIVISILAYNLYAQKEEKKAVAVEEKKEEGKPWEREVTGWRIKDFKPYIKAMKDLEKLTLEYAENVLRISIDEFSTGIDILEDMEFEVLKFKQTNKEKNMLNERWYWQEIDRKNRERRQISLMKTEAKMKSITYFVKAINHLDDIQSGEVRKRPEFVNFQSRLYQVYVSTQYDLHNFLPCIPILERYIAIRDENRKDPWAYKYLSSCYAFMEAVLNKYRHASEEKITQYKQKKNRYLLQAAELKYGVDSVQYKHLQEIVERDEKRTERLNDFQ
ncbi:MAG: hypothetical protein SVZ03_13220 [Spirochaetota bacterium]|nr:hypothetical protein [Spirochaetota bacterium]